MKNRTRKISALMRDAALLCGARAKSTGLPCKRPPASLTVGNGRCRLHGGIVGHPKTAESAARQLASTRTAIAARWDCTTPARTPKGKVCLMPVVALTDTE